MNNDYTLDTNAIFRNPYILDTFKDCNVYIPNVVLEEVDKYKNDIDLKKPSRIFSNFVDRLHDTNYVTENNVTVHFPIISMDEDLRYLGGFSNDNAIIHIAKVFKTVLISGDTNVRIKARKYALIEAHGVTSDFTNDNSDEIYKGYIEHYLADRLVDSLCKLGMISVSHFEDVQLYPHMFIIAKRFSGRSGDALAKVNADCTSIVFLQPLNSSYSYGIKAKNVEQTMALHLLIDEEIPLVTLSGIAGTGKTLLALAVGLMATRTHISGYKHLTLTTPVIEMGKSLGALPGDKEEKLAPYMDSFYDAMEVIFGGKDSMDYELQMKENLNMDAMNYLRGRSLPGRYFIGDEIQNTTKLEVKTLVTRMAIGSKIVLMGDPHQIDAHNLTQYNNGLVHVIDKFKNQPLGGHITLSDGVRSPLASIAADIL